jgi:hypothetical protein
LVSVAWMPSLQGSSFWWHTDIRVLYGEK